ncbi:MAG: right-handed parallel beta-helix repeat-containing protein [Myxococcota bacterium]|nr:right-handed parallel beta-helix repeat-containing protein [Myxococcota bacterium]
MFHRFTRLSLTLAGVVFTLSALAPTSAGAQVVISEVLAWTEVGQNTTDEFIELCNLGIADVDVAQWRLTDGDLLDALVAWNNHEEALAAPEGDNLVLDSSLILGGTCALVLDPNYPEGSQPYDIQPGTVILTVAQTNALGDALDTGDPITLFTGPGTSPADVADTYGTPVDAADWEDRDDDGLDAVPPTEVEEGRSSNRIDLAEPDSESNWSTAAPTPGYRTIGGAGEIVTVDASGTGDFLTISDAVLNVAEGTEIQILAGTYSENVSLRETVSLLGVDGSSSTIIEGNVEVLGLPEGTIVSDLTIVGTLHAEATSLNVRRCNTTAPLTGILFHNSQGAITENTISGGTTGILVRQGSAPEIADNTITETQTQWIACATGSAPTISNNTLAGSVGIGIECTNDPAINGNSITGFAEGIRLRTSEALVSDNSIVGATTAGILVESTGLAFPTITANIVAQNDGAGVLFSWTGGTLESNLIVGNGGPGVEVQGGFQDFISQELVAHPAILGNSIVANNLQGIYIWGSVVEDPDQVASPTIAANIVSSNAGFGIEQTVGTPILAYNNVFGNITGDTDTSLSDSDISEDPLFTDISTGDFTLLPESPCIDLAGEEVLWSSEVDLAGNPRAVDGDGDGIAQGDAGAFEYQDLCPDEDGDGYSHADCAQEGLGDCDDTNADIHPDAEEIWYDGVDQNCDGNDEDQDDDGFELDEDCDDTDPSIGSGDCDELLDLIDDLEACDCSMSSSKQAPSATWLLLLALGLLRRRRR